MAEKEKPVKVKSYTKLVIGVNGKITNLPVKETPRPVETDAELDTSHIRITRPRDHPNPVLSEQYIAEQIRVGYNAKQLVSYNWGRNFNLNLTTPNDLSAELIHSSTPRFYQITKNGVIVGAFGLVNNEKIIIPLVINLTSLVEVPIILKAIFEKFASEYGASVRWITVYVETSTKEAMDANSKIITVLNGFGLEQHTTIPGFTPFKVTLNSFRPIETEEEISRDEVVI